MIYVILVYSKGAIIKEFEVEGFEKAQKLHTHYEKLGYDVDLEPDTFAYLRKYPPQSKKPAANI